VRTTEAEAEAEVAWNAANGRAADAKNSITFLTMGRLSFVDMRGAAQQKARPGNRQLPRAR
jgi:hypothetical protein